MDKKGFELAISTLVVLIVGVILLVIIVLFITMGSNGLMDNIGAYFSYSNVDPVVRACNLFADSNQVYNYCCQQTKVKYYINSRKVSGNFTCNSMLKESFAINLKEFSCGEVSC